MGKDLSGKELGVGLGQRKDGRYSFKGTINGTRQEFTAHSLDEILEIQKKFKSKKKKIEMLDDSKYIYFVSDGTYCKIGYTKDVESRMTYLQIASSKKLKLLYSFKTFDYSNIENQLHAILKNYHVTGEWYDILFLFNGENNNERQSSNS